jgi:hypothetical protein
MKHSSILKSIIFLLLLWLEGIIPLYLPAQDVITINGYKTYKVNILFANKDSVRYTLESNDTTIITLSRIDVTDIIYHDVNKALRDEIFIMNKFHKYRRMSIAGAGLCAVGIGVGFLMGAQASDVEDYGDYFAAFGLGLISGVLVISGTAMMITGAVGAHKYKNLLKGFSLDLQNTPKVTGLTLRYKF